MDFAGLDQDTLANGRALNGAFIDLVAAEPSAPGVPADIERRIRGLDALQRARLADAPFLLFTVELVQACKWPADTGAVVARDLFAEQSTHSESRLVMATLALLWSLSRVDRHAARFLCGASPRWCDEIAATPLMVVMEIARRFDTLIVPRLPREKTFWDKLIISACDTRRPVRQAARFSALQCLLTLASEDALAPLAAAACSRRLPSREVAEDPRGNAPPDR